MPRTSSLKCFTAAGAAWLGVMLAAPAAFAIPIDFEIFRSSDPTDLIGAFTVDPDLAAAVGVSQVQMTAVSVTRNIAPFGVVTATLADVNPGNWPSIRAIFWNGTISEISAIASGVLPGLSFFFDFTPKMNPPLIDLDAVGSFAFDVWDGATIESFATSIGIRPVATLVPEPTSVALLLAGLAAVGFTRRRTTLRVRGERRNRPSDRSGRTPIRNAGALPAHPRTLKLSSGR